MASTRSRPLGEILLEARVVNLDQLQQALAFQDQAGVRLGEALVRLGFATEDDVAWALSTQLGLPYVHLRPDLVDPQALRLLPAAVQRRLGLLPVMVLGDDEVAVATADPTDEEALAEAERILGLRVRPVVALASNIHQVREALASQAPLQANGELALRLCLTNAAQRGATHVYVEPGPGRTVRVRYRTAAGLFCAEGPAVRPEALQELAGRAQADGTVAVEVVLADRSVEAALQAVPTRWGTAFAGPLVTVYDRPAQDAAGLPERVWSSVLEALEDGGLMVFASADAGLRLRLARAAAARLLERWGGLVVLAGAAGVRPLEGVVECPAAGARAWLRARPDAVVLHPTSLVTVRAVLAAAWPGLRLVAVLPVARAHQARAVLRAVPRPPLRGVLAAFPVPRLCGCADVNHLPYRGWPEPPEPTPWGSPRGCAACRQTGYAGEAVVYEWHARGETVKMGEVARRLVEAVAADPHTLARILEV